MYDIGGGGCNLGEKRKKINVDVNVKNPIKQQHVCKKDCRLTPSICAFKCNKVFWIREYLSNFTFIKL